MLELLKELGTYHVIGGVSIITVLVGFIFKKLNLISKIEKIFDKLDAKVESWSGSIGLNGFNTGVKITTKSNKMLVIGILYEHTIEPLLLLVVHCVAKLLKVVFGLVILWLDKLSEGMKSDNKEIKK